MKIKSYFLKKKMVVLAAGLIYYLFSVLPVYANGVAVTNVTLTEKNTVTGTVKINFTLSQQNVFGNATYDGKSYSDYIWVFVKYGILSGANVDSKLGYKHAHLYSGGNLANYSTVSGEGITADHKGAFIKASNAGPTGSNFSAIWNFIDDGVSIDANVQVNVCAIEMVKIPTGSFWYNVGGIGGSGHTGYADVNNYGGGSEKEVNNIAGYMPAGANNYSSDPGGPWPNGYKTFYVMKYEVSQGQYADFLNMLSENKAKSRYSNMTQYWVNPNAGQTPSCLSSYAGTSVVAYQYAISYNLDNPYGQRYIAAAGDRACNFMSWDDCMNYASWAGLRPMTEMEFEKAARGTSYNTIGSQPKAKYPWGDTDPLTGNTLYSIGSCPGYSASTTFDAYKFYTNFSDGSSSIDNYQDGPVNVGNYLSEDITRVDGTAAGNAKTGASPYGVADLSGNLAERVIYCSYTKTPQNGDGNLHVDFDQDLSWPASTLHRGGGFNVGTNTLRISDRSYYSEDHNGRWVCFSYAGFRCARTVD